MPTIKEQEELNTITADIVKNKAVLEECSDLLISLEEFSTTINDLVNCGKVVEPATVDMLNVAFNNIKQSTGLKVHSEIALESLTEENITATMEGIIDSVGGAIKKTWDAIGKTIRGFIDRKRAFLTIYFTSMKGLLNKVQALKAKVIKYRLQASTDKKINISANIAKATYVPSGSNLLSEIERINKRILDTSGGGEYEAYLEMLFHTMVNLGTTYKPNAGEAQKIQWKAIQEKLLACNLKAEDAFKTLTEGMVQTDKNKESTTYTDKVPYLGGLLGRFILYSGQIINDNYIGEYYPPEFSYWYNLDAVANVKATEVPASSNADIIKLLTALETMIRSIIEHRNDSFNRYTFISDIYQKAYDVIGDAENLAKK